MKNWSKKVSAIFLSLAGISMVVGSLAFGKTPDKEPKIEQKVTVGSARAFLLEHAKSNASVLMAFDTLSSTLQKAYAQHKIHDLNKILQAVDYAALKRESETLKDIAKTPYITHPMDVAEHLVSVGQVYDTDTLIAAMLHDVLAKTETTYEAIQKNFGDKVASIVRELTPDKTLSDQQAKEQQILNAPNLSQAAAVIKLSDIRYNLKDLIVNPPRNYSKTQIDQYFLWAEQLAARLPAANPHLKAEVDKLVKSYWDAREVKIETLPLSNS